MTAKLVAVNKLRPRITVQETVDLEKAAQRISKNTTYNVEEIYGMLRLYTREMIAALQCGATVKIDGLVSLSPNMKVGGEVDLGLRVDRGTIAGLNNPQLWTADKVSNHENLSKDSDMLVALWNEKNPTDPVTE
jgi:hypothetical protein